MGARGPKPGTVKRPPGAGRKKGTPNKATATVKEMAGKYGPDAIATLASIMKEGETEAGRIAAAKELLDRAYGKATQMVGGDQDNPLKLLQKIVLSGPDGV